MSQLDVKTGYELVEELQHVEPEFSVPVLLTDYFKIDELRANTIASLTHSARVLFASDGAFALGNDQPQIVEGARKINDYYFARRGNIVLNGVMTSTIAELFQTDTLRPTTPNIAASAAIRATAIFELGRYVSRRVYDLIIQNFRTARFAVPTSDSAGIAFFDAFSEELAKRGVVEKWDSSSYDITARSFYEREVRPEQFATRGGLMTLEALSPSIGAEQILARFRERRLNDQLGSIGCHALRQSGVSDEAISVQYPALTEMGALIPMGKRYFTILCESVQDPDQDTIVALKR